MKILLLLLVTVFIMACTTTVKKVERLEAQKDAVSKRLNRSPL